MPKEMKKIFSTGYSDIDFRKTNLENTDLKKIFAEYTDFKALASEMYNKHKTNKRTNNPIKIGKKYERTLQKEGIKW